MTDTISMSGKSSVTMPPIVTELVGDDRASALGITARSVTGLCRLLLKAGYDPAAELHAYRGATLALRVKSIRAGAKLTVRDNGTGKPVFRRWDGAESSAEAPPARKSVSADALHPPPRTRPLGLLPPRLSASNRISMPTKRPRQRRGAA